MAKVAPARPAEPIPLIVKSQRSDQLGSDIGPAGDLRPLVAVLAEIAARVERERASAGTDAA